MSNHATPLPRPTPPGRQRLFLACLAAATCIACDNGIVHGSLVAYVARFDRTLTARVDLPLADAARGFDIPLAHDGAWCRLTLSPRDASTPVAHCDELGGAGFFSCAEGERIALRWALSSCHSGIGRSLEDSGDDDRPAVAFGLGGNYVSALNQLDTARDSDGESIAAEEP